MNEETKPAISLKWDGEQQTVGLEFDSQQLKHWSMVKMVLTEALSIAEAQIELSRMQHLQRQVSEMRNAADLRNRLKLG